jgi:hypothetical protein
VPQGETDGFHILEVGSGSRGITAFGIAQVVGVDVCFSEKPATGMVALKASATALPLKSNRFAWVLSSDMLEHLESGSRNEAVSELLRVTKGSLLLACPCGSAARRVDGLLGRLYRYFGIPTPDWLKEHLELTLPNPDAIRQALETADAKAREVSGESVLTHFLVSLLISTNAANRCWTRLFLNRPDRAKRLGKCRLLKWGPGYRRLWVVKK